MLAREGRGVLIVLSGRGVERDSLAPHFTGDGPTVAVATQLSPILLKPALSGVRGAVPAKVLVEVKRPYAGVVLQFEKEFPKTTGRGLPIKGRSAQIIRRLPKKRRNAEGERLYFAVLLSQVRNRYLDSQMRLKIPLSRYLTRSTKANAPKTMFTAGSIQSDIEFAGQILALVPDRTGQVSLAPNLPLPHPTGR